MADQEASSSNTALSQEDDGAVGRAVETKTSSVYGIEAEETDEERRRAAEDREPLQRKKSDSNVVKHAPNQQAAASSPSAPPTTAATTSQQQQQGDLATANRLLRTCRNLIDQLNKQLAGEKEESARLREEFNKYKVRVELARKNTEMEITNLSEVNLKFKQYNVVSHDVQAELDALKRRYELLDRERVQARLEVSRLKEELALERASRVQAEDRLADVRRRSEQLGPEAVAQAKAEMAEELVEVRREFRLFREHHLRALEEKDAEISRARTSTEAATELAYLRDVVIKYLAAANDPVARTSMEAAIASVLRFNQSELDYVKEKRRSSDQSWRVALSALGI